MEFQAVILCGKGKGLSPLSAVRPNGVPKPLLPVANKPMLHYVLDWCADASFKGITIVTDSESRNSISTTVNSYQNDRTRDGKSAVKDVDIASLDYEHSGDAVTALAPKLLNSPFIVLPCDFLTDLPPQVLVDEYRNKRADELLISVAYRNSFDAIDKADMRPNYTIHTPLTEGRAVLLDSYTAESVESTKSLRPRTQMMWRFPRSVVSTKLLDSCISLCSPQVIPLLDPSLDGPGSENSSVTPSVANSVVNLHQKYGFGGLPTVAEPIVAQHPLRNPEGPWWRVVRDLSRRTWRHSVVESSVRLFVLPEAATFVRARTLSAYLEANRWVIKQAAAEKGKASAVAAGLGKSGAAVGADSLVGRDTVLGEKTSVKRSVVGENCVIGRRSKIVGCTVLNGVTIGDDVQLENCIIGAGAVIETKSRLTACNVEGGYKVGKGTQSKGEVLQSLVMSDIEGIEYLDSDDYDTDDSAVSGAESYVSYVGGDSDEFSDENPFGR